MKKVKYHVLSRGTIIGSPLYFPVCTEETLTWDREDARKGNILAITQEGKVLEGRLCQATLTKDTILSRIFGKDKLSAKLQSIDDALKTGLVYEMSITEPYGLSRETKIDEIPQAYRSSNCVMVSDILLLHNPKKRDAKPYFK